MFIVWKFVFHNYMLVFVIRSLHDLLISSVVLRITSIRPHGQDDLGWGAEVPKHTVHKDRSWSRRYIPIGAFWESTPLSSGWNKLTHPIALHLDENRLRTQLEKLLPPSTQQEAFLLVWGLENQAGQSKGANESSESHSGSMYGIFTIYLPTLTIKVD